jgi:hypothetical protein
MFGREPYPPPPPPPFLRDRMMGRFGVRVSFCSVGSFRHALAKYFSKRSQYFKGVLDNTCMLSYIVLACVSNGLQF